MALNSSRETLSQTINPQETIAEYAEKKGLSISAEDLAKHGKDILTSRQKDLLEQGKASLQQIIRFDLDHLSSNVDTTSVETALNRSSEVIKAGNLEATQALDSVESQMNELIGDPADSDVAKKAQEGIQQVRQAAEGAGVGVMLDKIGNSIGGFFGEIIKFFAKLLNGMKGMLGFGEKAEEATQAFKDALNPEKREETIVAIKSQLSNQFPEKSDQINSLLENKQLNEDALVNISEKIQKGESLNLSDFYSLSPDLEGLLFSEEERNALKDKAYEKLTTSLEIELEKKYNIDITGDKLIKLKSIVREYFSLSDSTAQTVNKMIDEKGFLFKDLYGIIAETGVKGTGFTFALLQEGIVTIGDITLDIVDTSMQVAKVSLGFLGITDKISYDDLVEKIGSFENPEFLLGLLYRKGGLFFSIMADISKTASTLAIESITNSTTTSGSLLKNSLLNRYDMQIKNFEKIAKAMGSSAEDALGILNDAKNNLKLIQNNYKILEVLKKYPNPDDLSKALAELNTLGIKGLEKIQSTKDFSKLIQIPTTNETKIWSEVASNYGYGKNAKVFELNQQLQKIATSQKMFIERGFLLKPLAKLSELREISNISRLGDQVIYHFDSVDDASKFSKKFATLANRAPELLGGLVDKMPIFAVAGLTAMEEGNFMDNIGKNLQTLIPFWGPIMMIGEGGAYLDENNEIVIKNPIEAGMGGVLLGLDTIFLTKALASGGARGAAGYMIKPIKDIYNLGRGTLDLGQSLIKLGASNGLKQAVNSGVSGLKSVPRYGKIAAALLVATVIGYETLTSDSREFLEDLESEGLIVNGKKNPEAIKKAIQENGLSQDEIKLLVHTTILGDSMIPLENIDFNIKNNELIIISYNEKIQGDWIISPETRGEIQDIFGIEYKGNFTYQVT